MGIKQCHNDKQQFLVTYLFNGTQLIKASRIVYARSIDRTTRIAVGRWTRVCPLKCCHRRAEAYDHRTTRGFPGSRVLNDESNADLYGYV